MIGVIPYLPDIPRFDSEALCAETDPDEFFPEQGGKTKAAKAVCKRCEVEEQCLTWALDHDEKFGVWGGKSERERRRMRRTVTGTQAAS